jgi:hypothetical protein
MAESLNARREGAPGPSPPASGADAVSTAMEQLNRLKGLGLVDDTEYQAKKQQLLDRL